LYDWEGGFKRGTILLFLLAIVFLDRRFSNRELPDRGNSTALVMIVVFLSTWHINYFVDNIRSYPVDVGEMTVLSLNLIWKEQKNPYSQEVDDITEDGVGDHPGLFLKGYRYFPVTLLVYSPLVLAFGMRGLYMTNLLLHIITVILI